MELECRTCLKISDNLLDLNSDNLPLKIETISAVEILVNDGFPSKICEECARSVHLLYEFRRIVIRSNEVLLRRLVKEEEISDDTKEEEICDDIKEEFVTDDLWGLEEVASEKEEDNDTFNCVQCNFKTSVEELLKDHKDKVHKTICNICGKLIIKNNLSHHILTHTGPPVLCKFCGKQLKNLGSLRGHLLSHKGIRHQCAVCGRVYINRKSYSDHMKRHKLGDVKTVECPTCGKLFYNKKTLVKHIRSHTGERPYPCEYCKKGFSSSHSLKTHIRQHTNEKPYSCDYCDMAFPQKVSLRSHLRTKHSEKTVEQNNTRTEIIS